MASIAREVAARTDDVSAARPRFGATDLMMLAVACIWGANFTVVKYGTHVLAPLAFNGVRVALAALALSLIALLRRGPWPSARELGTLLAIGMIGNGLYQVLFVEGIARTRASDAALVISAGPAFVALIGWLAGTERVSPRAWVGIALSIVGIALVVLGGTSAAPGQSTLLGNGLVLAGSLCWALFSVLLKPFTHRVDGVQLSAATMVGGAIALLTVASPSVAGANWRAVGPSAWGAIVYSGIAGLVIAYLFWYRGVRVLGPTRTAMYVNLQPIFALLIAWAVLGERPGIAQLPAPPGSWPACCSPARDGRAVKLVLFDIDGTLVLTDGAGRRAIHHALTEIFGSTGPADYRFDGKTDPQIVRDLMRFVGHADPHIDDRMPEVFALYVERLREELRAPGYRPRVLPGVFELLDALETYQGVVLGLLTGNLADGARAKLESVGIDPGRFRVGAYGSDHEQRPSLPDVARQRLRDALGIEIAGSDCIIIGDTPADVTCGRAVGARAIGVATGRYSTDELRRHGPIAVFADLSDTAAVVSAIVSDGAASSC
jgi:phosphoglycolate phosphatase